MAMAGTADGRVVIEIDGNNKKLVSALKDTTQEINKESKSWEDAGTGAAGTIGSAFEGMFTKITVSAAAAKIGQMLRDWAIASIDMASDLQEVQNVVDVTFGEKGAKKIEKWSKLAGSRYGLTELQAKKYTSTLGSMAKSTGMTDDQIYEMSTDLAGLAADVASFNNLSFDEAFYKIRAGLSGETEPLKAIGYDISETGLDAYAESLGLGKTSKMSMGEKYMLRYQYLMQQAQQKQTIGDFARTLPDSLANKQRLAETRKAELQAKTGDALMPLAQEWQDSILNAWSFILGDDGIVIQGTEKELQGMMATAQTQLATAQSPLNEKIRQWAAKLGIEEDEFEPGIFNSFEEYAYQTMLTRSTFDKSYRPALEELNPLQEAVTKAQEQVTNLQAQMDKLAKIEADTVGAGYDAANGVAIGVENAVPNVQSAVGHVNAALSGLGDMFVGKASFTRESVDGSHALGLDYVPFNHYLAELHEGEGILTAEENKVWQNFKYGGLSSRNTIDYDALGATMRDNVRAGGNVYLDGQTVGRVISASQANTYRAMERSGFQQ